jgi:hypothetical protein
MSRVSLRLLLLSVTLGVLIVELTFLLTGGIGVRESAIGISVWIVSAAVCWTGVWASMHVTPRVEAALAPPQRTEPTAAQQDQPMVLVPPWRMMMLFGAGTSALLVAVLGVAISGSFAYVFAGLIAGVVVGIGLFVMWVRRRKTLAEKGHRW